MLEWFQLVGKDLFLAGINNSHSGNLSLRKEKTLLITRTGAMLAHLQEQDIIETNLYTEDEYARYCSVELPVHKAIYQNTEAQAIVHAHPVFATATSLVENIITPIDAEASYLLGEVPVLKVDQTIGSQDVAEQLPVLLRDHKIVVVRGHGSFAVGKDLEEAFKYTNSLENACKIAYYAKMLVNKL